MKNAGYMIMRSPKIRNELTMLLRRDDIDTEGKINKKGLFVIVFSFSFLFPSFILAIFQTVKLGFSIIPFLTILVFIIIMIFQVSSIVSNGIKVYSNILDNDINRAEYRKYPGKLITRGIILIIGGVIFIIFLQL